MGRLRCCPELPVVKRSPVYRMVVRPYRPGQRRLLMLVGLLLLVLASLVAWHAGRHALMASVVGEGGDGEATVSHFERLIDENRTLREQLAQFHVGGDVARQVEEQVRAENLVLQDRVAELEQAIAYYRRVVVPDRSGKGLLVERFDVVPGGTPGSWQLQLLLVRTGEMDAAIEGTLTGTLVGAGPQGTLELPLEPLLPPEARGFRVRYIDDIKADLQLPEGLRPQRLRLALQVTTPRPARIERQWQAPTLAARPVTARPVAAPPQTQSQEDTANAGQE